MALKWMDRKHMSFFSQGIMAAVLKTGRDLHKPRCVQEYNLFMGGVDLKNNKLQQYETE
jgi:hypothetical protein